MTLAYAAGEDHAADLRLPDGDGSHPVAVLIHGGFWRHHWTRDTTDALAVDLARRGFATWNMEYRRVGMGGGYPSTLQDVAAAVAFLASDQASWITGVVLPIDGGTTGASPVPGM